MLRRNLEAMSVHHPGAAMVLRSRADDWRQSGYRVRAGADGRLRVEHDERDRVPGGAAVEQSLRNAIMQPGAAVIGGVGDGCVLPLLAPRPPGQHGATQAVYLCEPDTDRLLAALSVQDLSANDGPIASGSVLWFVGPSWHADYTEAITSNPRLPLPDIHARLGTGPETEAQWRVALRAREDARQERARAAKSWSDAVMETDLAPIISGQDAMPPRVLLITPRFTTVVRHSIAAAARGFEQLGWKARVCTEAADHERLSPEAVVAEVAEFRPHLILAVNYHRHHFTGVPDGVPFVCWIQDDMLHLIEPGAGDRLGPSDFVMGTWAHRYATEWGYPADRCVVVPRMTDAGGCSPGPSPTVTAPEMVYVSSHSGAPEKILDRLTAGVGTGTPQARAAARTGLDLIALYAAGESLADQRVLRRMLADAARDEGVAEPDEGWLSKVAELLSLHLNNPLYRQQGLAWAARVAESRGLTLSVYGPGWDRHPTLAPHARGPIAYGDDLDRVTRHADFNLRLEPYPAMCHQRLIDSIAAGGFVLNRRFSDAEEPEARFARIFLDRLAERAPTTTHAIALLEPHERPGFVALLDRLRAAIPRLADADLVTYYQQRLQSGSLADYIHSEHPPGFFDTVFGNETELGGLVDRFLADRPRRDALLAEQRAAINARHAYPAGLRLLLGRVRAALEAERSRRPAPAGSPL
ncbi:MAG: hypothetical protein LAT64_08370 [Phycisphaerales bacterium]|nr:hypothetical protein [Planctomycetota bacterium]MCH8508768.1 hypothetical protein [Phycisphaerales bacterium]